MANWIIRAAELWIRPVWESLKIELMKSPVIHVVEAVVQVLNELGWKATADSRMWCYSNGKGNRKSIVLFVDPKDLNSTRRI